MRPGRCMAIAAIAACSAALLVAPPARAETRCGDAKTRPWCKSSLSADRRADLLVRAMTLPEKLDFMAGDDVGGVFGVETSNNAHVGTLKGIPRLGIPTTYFADGPGGVRQGKATAPPAPIALAAGFDAQAASRYGAVVGNEAKHKGNDVIFGPAVDIMRTGRAGRTFEIYGEDPFLSSRLAVGWVRGAQQQGVIATVKHLGAYNQETTRMAVNAIVSPRALREIYLPAFEAAVKQGKAGSAMCAYNLLNGAYSCENKALLKDTLRGDWGFKGFTVSDYFAGKNTIGAGRNGLDLEMPIGLAYTPPLLAAAVATGAVPGKAIDEHVRNILRTMFAFGVFDRPAYQNDDKKIDKTAHAETARELEEAGITLLKNDGALPLRKPKSIALIGSEADAFKGGGGSALVNPFSFVTPRQGIQRRAGSDAKVTFNNGMIREEAVAAARTADVAIVFASDSMSEGADKPSLSLNAGVKLDQDGLIADVAKANPNTIVVLETGGPVLTPWLDKVKGVVEAWYPGQQGGAALARVLYGDVDPGGRLPVTFPVAERDAPTSGNLLQFPGVAGTVKYSEGVMVGYRHYDAKNITPRFPFGYGLSYTSFGYRDLSIQGGGNNVTVTATVTNTGGRAGTAVPQLYLGLPSPGVNVPQPPRQLKGFTKIHLGAGESRRVSFSLDGRAFSYWDEQTSSWKQAPGCYRVMVGSSSRDLPLTGGISRGGSGCN